MHCCLSLIVAMCAVYCIPLRASTTREVSAGEADGMKLVRADHPCIRYEGRWDFGDSLFPRFSWPGVSVSAVFRGKRVGVRLIDRTNYYNVYVDGALHGVFHPSRPGEASYVIADSLPDGRHSLTLSRRNITLDEVYTFCGLLLDESAALVAPPPEPLRRMEFVGDSFTAAESNEAKEQSLPWEARFPVTNIDAGFASLIARHFGAAAHMTCRSGCGMVCDWRGDTAGTVPARFDRVLMDVPLPKWDFNRWIPSVVVVCLGLNDYSGLKDSSGAVTAEKSAVFRGGYHRFLATLRRAYPEAKIVAVAPPESWIRRNVGEVVAKERTDGRTDVFYAQFDRFEGGYVANGHPTVATHRRIAGQIIDAIESFHLFPALLDPVAHPGKE